MNDAGGRVYLIAGLGLAAAAALSFFLLAGLGEDTPAPDDTDTVVTPLGAEDQHEPLQAGPAAVGTPTTPTGREEHALPARETGTIIGTVQVDRALRDSVDVYRVLVEEAVNDEATPGQTVPMKRFGRRFELGGATSGRFDFVGIPFSRYGWRVTVTVPGKEINGSSTVTQIDAEHPSSEVYLRVTHAISAHVVVKNQDREAVPGVDVTLRPIGRPPERRSHSGKTDPYGLWIVPKILAGRYVLVLGAAAKPLIPPREIRIGSDKLHTETVTLPRGGTLTMKVETTGGYPIPDCEVAAIARDSKLYRKYEARTDKAGRAVLQHLPPGRYYVHCTKQGYERDTKTVKVEDNKKNEGRAILNFSFRR